MNNEIGRKITSLTLMTIMLAGGMVIASPGMVPMAHAANANLFVSAENSQFDNYMSGPQVIEVVVINSDINDTDEAKGEPDVTVNGKVLRMVQGVDGNWYGYFADRTMSQIADSTTTVAGQGLDFGSFCSATSGDKATGVDTSDTNGIAVPSNAGSNGSATGATITTTCTGAGTGDSNNVVREEKDLSALNSGQIGVTTANWPFIQLYTLNPTGNVVVQYNKGGGAQSVSLTFDTVDNFAGATLDRAVYTTGAEIHATITDLWLNIDPTDEDSWTFGTFVTPSTNYQVFDENGSQAGDAVLGGVIDISGSLSALMCEDNCILLLDTDAQSKGNVITLQDNDDSAIVNAGDVTDATTFSTLGGNLVGTGPVTITEQGPNSGVFGTYDESDTSVIIMNVGALRGTSATVDYNESPVTILTGFDFGTIDIQALDDEWNSGEEIPLELTDADANRNSRADEDLDLNNPAVTLIPALETGDPFTLGEAGVEGSTVAQVVLATFPGVTGTTLNAVAVSEARAVTVDKFSERAIIATSSISSVTPVNSIIIDYETNAEDLQATISDSADLTFFGFNFYNQDVRSFDSTGTYTVWLLSNAGEIISDDGLNTISAGTTATMVATGISAQSGVVPAGGIAAAASTTIATLPITDSVGLAIVSSNAAVAKTGVMPIVADFFSFGFNNDGDVASDRIANQIIRMELEESGDNTGVFTGSLEYIMINQLNALDPSTYAGLTTIADDPSFIVVEDFTDEDSIRVNYLDLGSDGVSTQIADQEEAPSHSGIVSFDLDTYKTADTVVILLEDLDLNVDSDLIDIYTVVTAADDANVDVIGSATVLNGGTSILLTDGLQLGRVLDITFDDAIWTTPGVGTCTNTAGATLESLTTDTGLGATGFTLVETTKDSGKFQGDFQIPPVWCRAAATATETTTGLDIEVNYVDFRDASGEIIEVGDSAGVRANTGSVSLDRTVYPVPFGVPDNFVFDTDTAPDNRSVFPIHQTGMNAVVGLQAGEVLGNGDLTIHVRVNDADFDISASGEDTINENTAANAVGPVKISVIRGSAEVVLGYAGSASVDGVLDVGDVGVTKETATGALTFVVDDALTTNVDADDDGIPEVNGADAVVRQFGSIDEIAPDAGIFEIDVNLRYTDGPADTQCPTTTVYTSTDGSAISGQINRFSAVSAAGTDYCILQGDILQVEYSDPADASGDVNTITDSATFDLRNGVLQSDKSVYIIGSDMILTLIEPDLDLDNDQAETYLLDLVEWDSDAATVTMGPASPLTAAAFDPEPSNFRETGDSTGIFQIVIEIPEILLGDRLERGEEAILEYTDWGPSGSDFVGDEDEDVNLTIFTSNFGATVELDQKVYTWTDKVYITIVAPDHNFDGDLVDEIGETDLDPVKISTRGTDIDNYKLVETGTDTGIFTGEVILTGFTHDADGDTTTGTDGNDVINRAPSGTGPTDGLLSADDDDGLTVSFEFSEDETVVGSSLIRWNIGEVQWLEASYPASGTGVVRVIDPDMNLNPEAVDNFNVDVWSDSDAGGIDLTVTETNEATGIFEGTVFFTVTDESSGHRLRVAEGDTVTAEYEDNTLPDPYTTADELDITATSLIGTVVPPLERAPAANLRTVDAFGNSLDTVSVDQQVQISADLANGQDREQSFAYLVQIQDGNGVTVSLAWITGSLSAGQSFSPALSWIPTQAGTYTATAFVWESVDNPTALSPPVSTTVTVQ